MTLKKWIPVVVVIGLALMLVVMPVLGTACAGPGEKTLKIGMSTPSTGKAAEKGAPMRSDQ